MAVRNKDQKKKDLEYLIQTNNVGGILGLIKQKDTIVPMLEDATIVTRLVDIFTTLGQEDLLKFVDAFDMIEEGLPKPLKRRGQEASNFMTSFMVDLLLITPNDARHEPNECGWWNCIPTMCHGEEDDFQADFDDNTLSDVLYKLIVNLDQCNCGEIVVWEDLTKRSLNANKVKSMISHVSSTGEPQCLATALMQKHNVYATIFLDAVISEGINVLRMLRTDNFKHSDLLWPFRKELEGPAMSALEVLLANMHVLGGRFDDRGIGLIVLKYLDPKSEGRPTWEAYTMFKKLLQAIDAVPENLGREQLKRAFYRTRPRGEPLANIMLHLAYTYEYEGSGIWLDRALQYIDTYYLDVRGLRHLIAPQDEDAKNFAFQLLNCGPLNTSRIDSRNEEDLEKLKKLAWLTAALNDMADKNLGPRDLNLFYSPTIQNNNILKCTREYPHPHLSLTRVIIDRDVIQLVPRVQAQVQPVELAKLVSPAKLRTEIAREEGVNHLNIPKVTCFRCIGRGIIYSDTSAFDGVAEDSGSLSVKMTGLGRYQNVTWYYSKEGRRLAKRHGEVIKNTLRSRLAKRHGEVIIRDSKRIAFDAEFSATLEKAYHEGTSTVLCNGSYTDNAEWEKESQKRVDVEVDLTKMLLYDFQNACEKRIFRGDGLSLATNGGDKQDDTRRSTDGNRTLSLHNPRESKGDKENTTLTCWVCYGSGVTSRWFNKEVAGVAGSPTLSVKRRISNQLMTETDESAVKQTVDEHMPECLICYCEPGTYGLSAECDHMFCEDCASHSLQAILESGQFPACCPMCRAEGKVPKAGEISEPCGRITRPALTFLAERGVITKHFQFRFVNAIRRYDDTYINREAKDEFIECPHADCTICLYTEVVEPAKSSFGQCPCGQVICLLCHAGVNFVAPYKTESGQIVKWKHDCKKLGEQKALKEAKSKIEMEKDLALLAKVGKKCIACDMFIQKNEGCHIMMCGDTAHGSLVKALRNGGCGISFDWNTMKVCEDDFTDFGGERSRGHPLTARQIPGHPKCERPGCNFYASVDDCESQYVRRKKAAQRKNGGGTFCCDCCRNGKSQHGKYCHRIQHPDTLNSVTSSQTFLKDGENLTKWLQPFDAQLVQITFDSRQQPGEDYGNLHDALRAMTPTVYHQKAEVVEGFQFSLDVLGVDGKVLPVKQIYTKNCLVTRLHSALTPEKPITKINVEQPYFPAVVSHTRNMFPAENFRDRFTTMVSLSSKKFGEMVGLKEEATNEGDTPLADIDIQSGRLTILFDLGVVHRVTGLRSPLMSRYAVGIQHASVSAEEAVLAKHWFTEYSVLLQSALVNSAVDDNKINKGKKADGKKLSKKKKDGEERAKEGETKNDRNVQELKRAYEMIAEEREMILAALGGTGCECPGCGQVIVRNGGDNNVMCGCEAEAAGGTMAKALAGGGCGACFDTVTLKIINPKNGDHSRPANGRQWKFHR